jgi:hypothetical protein
MPGARLLAGRLGRRGVDARARGRLVWVLLAAADGDAASLVRRVEAGAGGVPSVLGVMAPRDEPVDTLVADCERAIVVAEPGSALAALALDEIAALGRPARPIAPIPAGPARLAALAGLRSAQAEIDEVVA